MILWLASETITDIIITATLVWYLWVTLLSSDLWLILLQGQVFQDLNPGVYLWWLIWCRDNTKQVSNTPILWSIALSEVSAHFEFESLSGTRSNVPLVSSDSSDGSYNCSCSNARFDLLPSQCKSIRHLWFRSADHHHSRLDCQFSPDCLKQIVLTEWSRHLIFNFPLCKLYTNSLMSSLNSRRGWRFTSAKGSTAVQSDGNLGIISTEDFIQTPLTPTSPRGNKHYRASQNIAIKLREGVYRSNRTMSLSRPVSRHSLSFSRGSEVGITLYMSGCGVAHWSRSKSSSRGIRPCGIAPNRGWKRLNRGIQSESLTQS